MKTTIKTWVALIEKSSKETNEQDTWRHPRIKDEHRTIYGMFFPTERYLIDFAEDFHTDEWAQFDTWQDAPYFGVWHSRKLMMSLTYAEGDWSLVRCANIEAFEKEIQDCVDFYEKDKKAV